jgi:signal transduction histidine kinase
MSGRGRRTRIAKLAWAGIVLVAALALLLSLNATTYLLLTKPADVWFEAFIRLLEIHLTIGVAILAAAVLVSHSVPASGALQYVAAAIAILIATAIVLFVVYDFSDVLDEPWPVLSTEMLMYTADIFRYSLLGSVITCAWLYLRAEAEHAAAAEQVAIDTERMNRQTAEARLQMLEAQIEPHFLFNTLAHVKRLYDTDRDAGVRMMRNLKEYLSVALPQMREGVATLGREIDHTVAYLGIQKIRMGRRLAYGIDIPEDLRDARLPPLMVLTLVENAVKHGLSPLQKGGRIDVRATSTGGRLRIEIADTGSGFTKSEGGGTGLANIRARLTSTYGTAARFSLALNQPTGVIATIELPFQPVIPPVAPP